MAETTGDPHNAAPLGGAAGFWAAQRSFGWRSGLPAGLSERLWVAQRFTGASERVPVGGTAGFWAAQRAFGWRSRPLGGAAGLWVAQRAFGRRSRPLGGAAVYRCDSGAQEPHRL